MQQGSMLNSSMKEQILKLVQTQPRHYTGMIRRDPKLRQWVEDHSSKQDNWQTRIWSAVHNKDPACPNGNRMRVARWSEGLVGCGPAAQCACTRERIRTSVKSTKSQVSSETQAQINQRRACTMQERYGVAYNSQRPDIKHMWKQPRVHEQASDLLKDAAWLRTQYQTHKRTLCDIGDELGVYYGTVAHWARQHGIEIRQQVNRSQMEDHIAEWLRKQSVSVTQGDWSILGNRELDIFLPDHQLAIEVNGLFWHSWNPSVGIPEDRERHVHKLARCREQGIRLIQITDWHWNHCCEPVTGVLKSALGLNQVIGARHTRVERIQPNQARKFMNQHHLSGFCAAREHWALIHNNQPVMCVSVGRNRFDRNQSCAELVRMATASGVTVTGGFSRLLAQLNQPLISYVDNDWFTGAGYARVGFQHVRDTGPGYWWTDGNTIISRHRCQKANLAKWLPSFDPELSESKNLFAAGFRRYWNSGNSVWKWDPVS